MNILRIDSSPNIATSTTRTLSDAIIASQPGAHVVTRDLAAHPLPQVTQDWNAARLVPVADRTMAQNDLLALSDTLIAEIRAADILLIGAPVYNFAVPAALKAWIDLIARPGETFRYGDTGLEGFLTGKKAIIAFASGGTVMGSNIDFASGYLRHVLGFVGITDTTFVAADGLSRDAKAVMQRAHQQITDLNLVA